MRLATYGFGDGAGPALVDGETVADLRALAPTMRALLERGLAGVEAGARAGRREPLDPARLLAPVPEPGAFLGIGLNYRDHVAEMGHALPEHPAVFAKLRGAVAPPYGRIVHHATLDYEGELGVVIGRRCFRADERAAREAVAGYVVVNDLTVRALGGPDTRVLAKSVAGGGPFGPWIVTADELGDPHDLRIRTWVGGELRQDGSTRDLIHGVFALVALLSRTIELAPGDVITTGSPAGVGAGFRPPRYLEPGDRVRVEIDRIGAIETEVVGP